MSSMNSRRRRFSHEFKSEIPRFLLNGQKTVPQVSQEHGIHESVLDGCVKQAQIAQEQGAFDALTSAEKTKLTALRKKSRELKRERDFLKDAAVYFAKAKTKLPTLPRR